MAETSLFSAEECAQIRNLIHEVRDLWIPRELHFEHDGTSYRAKSYTLGVASYCDALGGPEPYLESAKRTNVELRGHFGWIYERLAEVLQRVTGRSIVYDEHLALPGFHIFPASPVFELPVAPIHYDFHHRLLNWEGKDASFRDTISFTASISLPLGGAGLNVWDLTSWEVEGMAYEDVKALAGRRDKRFVRYTVGHLFIHPGDVFHQIAPWRRISEGEERITLQGQGILVKGAYLLFW